jgi:hypothetical protein
MRYHALAANLSSWLRLYHMPRSSLASFGLILDLIGFLLLLIFVLVSSLTLFARSNPARRTAPALEAP